MTLREQILVARGVPREQFATLTTELNAVLTKLTSDLKELVELWERVRDLPENKSTKFLDMETDEELVRAWETCFVMLGKCLNDLVSLLEMES